MARKTEANIEARNAMIARPPAVALDFLEDRLFRCPCCDEEFYERTVRLNELTLLGRDSDLRPIYSPVDPILYDLAVCRKCGYGALSKTFANLSFAKAQTIMSQMPSRFKNMKFPQVYTEDIAILRYKAALMSAMLTKEKSGVLAYLYMRLAWIYRNMGDVLTEKKMIAASLEGFFEAVQKDFFPIVDLDGETVYYIMEDFLRRLSMERDSERYFSRAFRGKVGSFGFVN